MPIYDIMINFPSTQIPNLIRQILVKWRDKFNYLWKYRRLYLDIPAPLKAEISVNNIIENFTTKDPPLSKADLRREVLLALDSEDNDEREGTNSISATASISSRDEDMAHVNKDMYPNLETSKAAIYLDMIESLTKT